MFKFDPKKLNTKKKLEYSRHANIYPYQKGPDDTKWAVKCLHPKDFPEFQRVLQEIISTSNIEHPSILPLRSYYLKEDEIEGWRVFIKMHRMDRSLEELIREHSKPDAGFLPKEKVIKYFYVLASALEHLEAKRISHGAVKPSNILLDQQGNIKLSGIGGEGSVTENSVHYRENEVYMAPEMWKQDNMLAMSKKHSLYKADVWSLGIVITELCLLKPKQILGSMTDLEKEEIIKKNMKEIYENYGEDLAYLLENGLLCIDPSQRKSFSEICHSLEDNFLNAGVTQSAREVRISSEEEKLSMCDSERTSLSLHHSHHQRRRRGVLVVNEGRKQDKVIKENKVEAKKPVEGSQAAMEEMQRKWKGIFEFDPNEILKVTASAPYTSEANQVSNEKLIEMVNDLNKSLTDFKVTDVKKFALNLTRCDKITDAVLPTMMLSMNQDLKNIEEFSLNLSQCKMITYNGTLQLALDIKQNMKNLKQLALDFRDCEGVSSTAKESTKMFLNNIPQLTIL